MLATLRSFVWWLIHPFMRIVGRAYVPGPKLEQAVAIARKYEEQGIPCTIGYFPEEDDEPAHVADISRQVISACAQLSTPGYVSIKVPMMDFEPDLLAGLVDLALKSHVRLHFDSHAVDEADQTLECLERARCAGCQVGLTIPGRWSRSLEDAAFAAERDVRVRIVKGEWMDPDEPDKDATAGYLDVVDVLAGKVSEVAVATHDPKTGRRAIERFQVQNTACELELLYGMPMRSMLALAREKSVPVRVYIPFGTAWWPYSLGKVKSNPKILLWLIIDALQGLRQLITHR